MDPAWYIKTNDGHEEGPLSPAILKSRAQQGQVTPQTMVRHGTDGNWVTASHVKGLFAPGLKEADVCEWLVDQQQPRSGLPDHEESHEVGSKPPPATHETQDSVASETKFTPVAAPPSPLAKAVREESRQAPGPVCRSPEPAASESPNASRLVPCVDCGKPISRLASICPSCGCPVIEPSRPDKYPALQFIAGVNRFFAVVIPVVCLCGLIIISSNKSWGATPETIIPLVVYMVVAPLALWGTAELILLLIGIENNTSTLRGMTPEERKAKANYRQLLEERTREAEEEKQVRHEEARRKLSPDLHAVIGQTGKTVAVEVELVEPIAIRSFISTPFGYLGFVPVDKRPWLERFLGKKTMWITGYIEFARIAELALSSNVKRVNSWHPAS